MSYVSHYSTLVAHKSYREVGISIKNLGRLNSRGIHDVPVVDGSLGDETQASFANPFPEDNVLVHCAGLEFGFGCKIKYLKCPRLGLERNDLLVPVHDSTISLNGPSDDIVSIFQLDDDHFWLGGFIYFLADAKELVGLERLMRKGC
jgi:hypothetical protein